MVIKVSDAYVLEANVTVGGAATIEVGNGTYEHANERAGMILSKGGVNDMNGNGMPDAGEPLAPDMKAGSGWHNVNPFTTRLENNDSNLSGLYPTASTYMTASGLQYDFDVVKVGQGDGNTTGNLDIAKEAAKAALAISGYPGDGNVPASSSSAPASSSSAAASSSSVNSPFPAAARADECFDVYPGYCDSLSSSSDSNSSSSESSSSSSSVSGGTAYSDIDNCLDTACVNSVLETYLAQLNGVYEEPASSSSEASSSSDSNSSSSEASSSSVASPFPAAER